MKNICLGLLLFTTFGYSQKEFNNWYFGGKAAVSFNTGVPIVLTDSQMIAIEGCASISNSSGELLFYTNGDKIWNKDHSIMQNGTGLHGYTTSTQAALIIQKPGSASLYYVFTAETIAGYGLKYSEVDMTQQGGLGEVISKNIPLTSPTCEKVTAVEMPEGYWIVTHVANSNAFQSFKVISAGVDTVPVVSNVGQFISGVINNLDYPGYLKASPKGDKIVCVNQTTSIELFDFDVFTGKLSNVKILHTGIAQYGVEFSPSGKLLYATANYRKKILQFNLEANDIASSVLALVDLPLQDNREFFAMQLGPDRKIYFTNDNENFLGVVHNPEIIGVDCNIDFNYVNLERSGSWSSIIRGLPNFCTGYLFKEYNLPVTVAIPKGISPNSDGKNDIFDLTDLDVHYLTILNRYGLKVYSKPNYKDEWHGQDKNDSDLPDGTYYYHVQMTSMVKTGWVYINRAH